MYRSDYVLKFFFDFSIDSKIQRFWILGITSMVVLFDFFFRIADWENSSRESVVMSFKKELSGRKQIRNYLETTKKKSREKKLVCFCEALEHVK